MRVFRKSRTNRQGKACWWFHLKGDEKDLCDLEKEWNVVALQTQWKLEYCYKPNAIVQADNPASDPVSTEHVQLNNSPAATNNPSPPAVELKDDENSTSSTTATLPLVEPIQQCAEIAGHSDNDQATQE